MVKKSCQSVLQSGNPDPFPLIYKSITDAKQKTLGFF